MRRDCRLHLRCCCRCCLLHSHCSCSHTLQMRCTAAAAHGAHAACQSPPKSSLCTTIDLTPNTCISICSRQSCSASVAESASCLVFLAWSFDLCERSGRSFCRTHPHLLEFGFFIMSAARLALLISWEVQSGAGFRGSRRGGRIRIPFAAVTD